LPVETFNPPIALPSPGALVRMASIGSPASSFAFTCSGESFASSDFSSTVAAASVRA
jgi:hypothetical protein